jgi:hypothetical protein
MAFGWIGSTTAFGAVAAFNLHAGPALPVAGRGQCRCTRARSFITGQQNNHLLTKLDYQGSWAFGARVLACGPAGSVGVDPWPLTRKKSSPSPITAR